MVSSYFCIYSPCSYQLTYSRFDITNGPHLPGLSNLTVSIKVSRAAAVPLSLDLMLLLLPMCRITATQLRLFIKWIPLEVSAWFHRQVAYTMLFYAIVHTSAHFIKLGALPGIELITILTAFSFYLIENSQLRPETAMQIHYTQVAGITGHIMIFCMVIIYTFAHKSIREQSFEAFQWGHRLFIVFLFAAWTHGAGCFVRTTAEPYYITDPKNYWTHCVGYQSWRWESWFSVLYILERIYAYLYYQRRVTVSKVLLHPANVLEIRVDKGGMNYRAGQWIFIKCPAVSTTQWHPFSISSCPYDPYISVHIRQAGDFTRALRDLFNNRITPAYNMAEFDTSISQARNQEQEMPGIIIEGPYGSPAEDIFGNEVAVLIGAGIGVTPWASVLKSLWHLRDPKFSKVGHRLRRVEFIWACRDLTMFEWFQSLITSLNDQSLALESSDRSIRVHCHTYMTGPSDAGQSANNQKEETMINDIGISSTVDTQDGVPPYSSVKNSEHNNVHTGRPNFKAIFRDIKDSLDIGTDNNNTRGRLRGKYQIGVNFCGPKAMAREVRLACADATSEDIRFRFSKRDLLA